MSQTNNSRPFTKISLEPKNNSFSEIMGNGKLYVIPRFQRDYSWNNDQWKELWQDIETMRQQRVQHFMGYLVIQTADDKEYKIIDGQQRITTISIIILAAIKALQSLVEQGLEVEQNKRRMESFQNTYIGAFNPITLKTRPKLKLNRHNDKHFRSLASKLDIPQQRGIIHSNRLINRAFTYFQEQISNINEGSHIAQLISDLADGLLFTNIIVNNDLNAFTIFETLNARGVHLSTPDLVKNSLLSIIDREENTTEQEFDALEEEWEIILEQLGTQNFTHFLRHQWGMRNPIPSKADIYKTIKRDISNASQVFKYLKQLNDNAPLYAALQNCHDEFWNEKNNKETITKSLYFLQVFHIRTPLSLLMSAYQMTMVDFTRLLSNIVIFSMRYNVVCGKNAKDQERIYNKMAQAISKENASLSDIMSMLKPFYPDDEEFSNHFSTLTIPTRRSPKKANYILREIENHLNAALCISDSFTLEHILPFSPGDEWQIYFGQDDYNTAIDRLGNLALLSDSQNLGHESFEEKKQILSKTPYIINEKITGYNKWNINNVDQHQKWLAKQAKSIWKLRF